MGEKRTEEGFERLLSRACSGGRPPPPPPHSQALEPFACVTFRETDWQETCGGQAEGRPPAAHSRWHWVPQSGTVATCLDWRATGCQWPRVILASSRLSRQPPLKIHCMGKTPYGRQQGWPLSPARGLPLGDGGLLGLRGAGPAARLFRGLDFGQILPPFPPGVCLLARNATITLSEQGLRSQLPWSGPQAGAGGRRFCLWPANVALRSRGTLPVVAHSVPRSQGSCLHWAGGSAHVLLPSLSQQAPSSQTEPCPGMRCCQNGQRNLPDPRLLPATRTCNLSAAGGEEDLEAPCSCKAEGE